MTKNNLELWDSVSETEVKHTKEVSFGRKFTAIDAHYQVKRATEVFGPMGKGWGTEVLDKSYTENSVHIYLKLWYENKEQYVTHYGGAPLANKGVDDSESHKKAMTNAMTKCLSLLGFNADVFLGQFEDNVYIDNLKKKQREITIDDKKAQRDYFYYISSSMETDEVDQYIEQINGLDLPEAIKDSLLDAADTRKQQIENGVHPEPSWGFINVAEAEELFNSVVNFINKADDSKKLTDVITSREYKLKALDFMLKGKKWTFDGLTPYRHIVKLYENKNIQLTEK